MWVMEWFWKLFQLRFKLTSKWFAQPSQKISAQISHRHNVARLYNIQQLMWIGAVRVKLIMALIIERSNEKIATHVAVRQEAINNIGNRGRTTFDRLNLIRSRRFMF